MGGQGLGAILAKKNNKTGVQGLWDLAIESYN
jgi:hypothetical protein